MAREPIPTCFFALVVVRRADRFLVVRETKHGGGWYLPAGRAEPGETLIEAAHRETLEEAGMPIELEGLLKLLHTPYPDSARVHAVFLARPAADVPPKSRPDEHSQEARWVTLDEVRRLPLRSADLANLFAWVAEGAAVYPLDLLGRAR